MTDATLVRFLSTVYEAVVLQGAAVSECFMTDATLVRFLSTEYEAVVLQVMCLYLVSGHHSLLPLHNISRQITYGEKAGCG
jgi:hypothetical protein